MSTRAVAPDTAYADGVTALMAGEKQELGGRKQQEDRCVCVPDLNAYAQKHQIELSGDVRRAFYAVFDGFGGYTSSDWLKENFHKALIKHEAFADDPHKALQETFATVDTALLEHTDSMDKRRHGGDARYVRSGSCGTVCLVVGNEAHVANVGDSSCVVYRRKATAAAPLAEMISIDHKAGLQSERDRVAAAGGTTEQKTQELQGFLCWKSRVVPVGPVRVQPGGLAVSRAFGAGHSKLERLHGKPGCVVCEPAMRRLTLDAELLCLVLASDGVWDNVRKLTDLHSTLKQTITMAADVRRAARFAAEAVVAHSIRYSPSAEGQDNTTALVVIVGPEAAAAAAMS